MLSEHDNTIQYQWNVKCMMSLYFLCHARIIKYLNVWSICLVLSWFVLLPGPPPSLLNQVYYLAEYVKHRIINYTPPSRCVWLKLYCFVDWWPTFTIVWEWERGRSRVWLTQLRTVHSIIRFTATGNSTERTNKGTILNDPSWRTVRQTESGKITIQSITTTQQRISTNTTEEQH